MIPPPQGVPPPMPMASHMNMMPPQSMNMNANAPPLGPPPGPVPGMGGYPLYPPYHDQPPNDNMSTYSTNMKEPNIGLVADVLRIGLMSGGETYKPLPHTREQLLANSTYIPMAKQDARIEARVENYYAQLTEERENILYSLTSKKTGTLDRSRKTNSSRSRSRSSSSSNSSDRSERNSRSSSGSRYRSRSRSRSSDIDGRRRNRLLRSTSRERDTRRSRKRGRSRS